MGSGVIDAYAGWIGTIGAKVDLGKDQLATGSSKNDEKQLFTRLASVAGTSTCHLAMRPDPVFVPGVWGPYRDTVLPGFWMAEGGQSATGELLKHVIETHPAYNQALSLATSYNKNIYSYLNDHLHEMARTQHAPSISYLAGNLFFYGDLWGNRSPLADTSMKGSIVGVSSERTVDSLCIYYYATLEFIALQTKQIIDVMNEAGHEITSMFMSGSQCQNDVLVGLIATASEIPVLTPQYVHAAVCHGAAMLGAKAASADAQGKTVGLWDIMDRMSKPGQKVSPSDDFHEKALLKAKYQVFLDQCSKQQEYRALVNKAVGSWKSV